MELSERRLSPWKPETQRFDKLYNWSMYKGQVGWLKTNNQRESITRSVPSTAIQRTSRLCYYYQCFSRAAYVLDSDYTIVSTDAAPILNMWASVVAWITDLLTEAVIHCLPTTSWSQILIKLVERKRLEGPFESAVSSQATNTWTENMLLHATLFNQSFWVRVRLFLGQLFRNSVSMQFIIKLYNAAMFHSDLPFSPLFIIQYKSKFSLNFLFCFFV